MNSKIGNLEFKTPFFLAPLAGITDAPTRRISKRMGAALVYSEMISAKGLYYGENNTQRLLSIYDDEMPIAYQIFGSEPDFLAYATRNLENRKNEIIDINMGCPVPKIVKNGEGAALMKNPNLVYKVVKAVKENTAKPVTAKIRLGMDDKSINFLEVAAAIEEAGASAITLHGRTREQYYSGKANWECIRLLVDKSKIPIIGNGDVDSYHKAKQMFEETGCKFIMIGRAALGNPWIFQELNMGYEGNSLPEPITLEEKMNTILQHYEDMEALKGEYCAVREMRKHIGWYTKGMHGSAIIRGNINQITSGKKLKKLINELKKCKTTKNI